MSALPPTWADELRAIVREELERAIGERDAKPDNIEWLDTKGAAALLGVCTRTVAQMASRGDLPHAKLSDRILRFRRADVLALLERKSA